MKLRRGFSQELDKNGSWKLLESEIVQKEIISKELKQEFNLPFIEKISCVYCGAEMVNLDRYCYECGLLTETGKNREIQRRRKEMDEFNNTK